MNTALEIEGLGKSAAGRRLLDDISLSLPQGGSLALLGANGAGKTTLLKCLLGLAHPDQGRATLFGEATDRPAARRHLCYLPERFMAPSYLKGRAVLREMLALHGVSWSEEAVAHWMDALALDPACLERPVRRFSKGMMQKLGLIACFLSERPMIVMDEPMSGLDPLARRRLVACLERQRAAGRTLVFTTHMLRDAESVCDHVGFLDRGRLLFFGTLQACRQRFAQSSIEEAYLSLIAPSGLQRVA